MVKNFSDTWDSIETVLKANAVLLGVDDKFIKKGDRETPQRAPFLTVYLLPSDVKRSESGTIAAPLASCLVFCGVAPSKTLSDSIVSAMTLATKVVSVLQSIPELTFTGNPFEFDEDSSVYTCVSVSFNIRYKLF
jgi:hypothetical protein